LKKIINGEIAILKKIPKTKTLMMMKDIAKDIGSLQNMIQVTSSMLE